MGKMNFVSGGYYGKVGQTVGQRWRNTRTVRAYVIPRNPRTETQQANRANFADCTGATQLALQLNGQSLLWDNSKNTAFNNRMAESRKYAELGGGFYSYIPVLPYGYEPAYNFDPTPELNNTVLSWTCTAQDNLAGREMAIAMQLYNTNTDKNVRHIVRTTVSGTAGNWQMSYTLPTGYRLNSESWQIGISCDDTVSALPSVYLPAYSLADIKIKKTVTAQSLALSYNEAGAVYSGTVTLSDTIESSAVPLVAATLSGVLLGESVTQQTVIQTATADGKLAFTFTPRKDSLNQRILFPSGSVCTLDAATFESDLYIYTLQNASLSFSAALVTQNWTKQALSATKNASGTWSVNTGITGASNPSGALGFTATDIKPDLSTFTLSKSLDSATSSPALVFTESSPSGNIIYKSAQTLPLSAVPSFQKAGVTYKINAESTVALPAGSAVFTLAAESVTVTNGSATGQPTVKISVSESLASALSLSGTLVCRGVVQAAWQTQSVSVTLSVNANNLVANPVFSTDTASQPPHFPSGSTVNVPTLQNTLDGYTYKITGGTFSVTEPNIPTLTYFVTETDNEEEQPETLYVWLFPANVTVSGTASSYRLVRNDETDIKITSCTYSFGTYQKSAYLNYLTSTAYEPAQKNGKPYITGTAKASFSHLGISWQTDLVSALQSSNAIKQNATLPTITTGWYNNENPSRVTIYTYPMDSLGGDWSATSFSTNIESGDVLYVKPESVAQRTFSNPAAWSLQSASLAADTTQIILLIKDATLEDWLVTQESEYSFSGMNITASFSGILTATSASLGTMQFYYSLGRITYDY